MHSLIFVLLFWSKRLWTWQGSELTLFLQRTWRITGLLVWPRKPSRSISWCYKAEPLVKWLTGLGWILYLTALSLFCCHASMSKTNSNTLVSQPAYRDRQTRFLAFRVFLPPIPMQHSLFISQIKPNVHFSFFLPGAVLTARHVQMWQDELHPNSLDEHKDGGGSTVISPQTQWMFSSLSRVHF